MDRDPSTRPHPNVDGGGQDVPMDGDVRLPMSRAQLGVWQARQLDPASPAYDIGGYAEIRGPLDAGLLERAGQAMLDEVAAFRVRIDDSTEPATQVIAPTGRLPLGRHTFPGAADAEAWMRAELAVPRDPARDPVVEVALLRIGPERISPDRHWWFVRSHHVVLDGFSVPLVCGRVAEIYTALVRGAAPAASPFGAYRLLLDEERDYRASPDFDVDRNFWLGRLAGVHDVATLSDRTGPPLGPFHRSSLLLPPGLLDDLPRRVWVPALMAAFAGYLSRLTGADELRLGVPLAGRYGPLLRIPGNAANLLPLRITARPDVTTAAVAAELRLVRRHQRYRGEDLARDLGAVGAGPAVFGPSVNIRDFHHGLDFGGSATVLHDVTAGPVEDLTLSVRRPGGSFELLLDGNAGAYRRADVEEHLPRFAEHLAAFLSGKTSSTDRRREHRRGVPAASRPPLLADAFAEQAGRTPAEVALRDGDRAWTFVELAAEVDRLAGELRAAGVGPDRLVALDLPRSAEYVIRLLAVARAGGAWVPVDPRRPPAALHGGPATGGELGPAHLAYVLTTSGSTGRPKAVQVTQGAVANLLDSHRRGIMARGRRMRVAHTAPFTVDAALDPLLWMVAGHELVLLPEEIYRDPYALVRAVREQAVDVLDVPPSYLRVLLDAGLGDHPPALLIFGGEAPPAELWTRLRGVPAINAYGPTEYTVDALLGSAPGVLGEPVAGTRALVLDAALRPVPPGGVGELYLGGPGLARGYAGQPGLTSSWFVADPLGPPGGRLFRTGDRVRVRFGGDLEFLGRTDDQVKIRGFRVEPREVESVLAGHPDVLACAVVARREERPRLIGYAVPRAAAGVEPAALLVHLRGRLPDHLVPAAIVLLDALPLAADGTLDRRALPDPGPLGDRPYRAPATTTEAAIGAAFAEVLDVGRVGADDDFFALGGDSLSAGRLLGAVRARLGVELGLRAVFDHRTVRSLAAAIEGR
jgi:non-ribosomal peptide synthetase component F/acyl carrier protein